MNNTPAFDFSVFQPNAKFAVPTVTPYVPDMVQPSIPDVTMLQQTLPGVTEEAPISVPTEVGSTSDRLTPQQGVIELVKKLEGFTPEAKWDYQQYSAGYGTRAKKGERLTEEQALERLKKELEASDFSVAQAAKKKPFQLNKNQIGALVSFDFNTGKGAHVLRKAKNVEDLKRLMAQYTKAGGKKLPGLVKRRNAEISLFDTPVNSVSEPSMAEARKISQAVPANAVQLASSPVRVVPQAIQTPEPVIVPEIVAPRTLRRTRLVTAPANQYVRPSWRTR